MASNEDLMTKAADILVVDDTIASLRLLTEILTKEGYQVRPVEKPQLALESALAHPPSLILLDVKMPEMSGFEVCQRLKKDERTREVPIIFVSALQELQDRIEGFEVGGVDFIIKPVQEQEVLVRVKTHLQLRNAQLHMEGLVAERTAELLKSHDELRTSENRYRSVVEDSPLLICNFEPGGALTYINNAYSSYFDKDPQELVGTSIFTLIPNEERDRVAAEISELTPEVPVNVHEHSVIGPKNQIRWMRWTNRALFDEHDRVTSYQSFGEDITEHNQAVEALKVSEKRFKDVADNTLGWIWEVDNNGKYTYASPTVERVLGYKPEEILQKHFYDLFYPDDKEELKRAAFEVFASKEVFREFPNRNVHKNGTVIWLSTSGLPIYDEGGVLLGYRGADTDITERKRVEETLKESEEKFRTLVTNSEQIVYVIAKDGTFLLSEGKGLSKLGLKSGEVVGESVFELYENYPYMLDSIRKAFNGETMTIEVNVGGNNFINWYTPQKDNEGEISGILGLSVNITEQKKAEQRLRESEERFRATFDQAAVGIDLEALDGCFLRINQKFCDIVGYSQEEMLERSFQDITHPDDLDMDDEYAQRMLDDQLESYSTEKRYIHKNGEIVWVNVTVSLVRGETGSPSYFISVVENITERKEAELRVQEYQERLKALASQLTLTEEMERRRIAADLHDHIGQVLAVARMELSLVSKATSDAKIVASLDQISNNLLQAIQETRDLVFDLSSPVLIELGLQAAISKWLEEQINKKYSLKTEFIHDEPALSLSEDMEGILFRSLRELLANVVKHAHAESVIVRLESDDHILRLSVKDDGVGCALGEIPGELERGRGFGLFNVQERMMDLGGSLEIICESGEGFEVTLTAPISPP